jgi:hypothetical protein
MGSTTSIISSKLNRRDLGEVLALGAKIEREGFSRPLDDEGVMTKIAVDLVDAERARRNQSVMQLASAASSR